MQKITINHEVKVPSTRGSDPDTGLVLQGLPPETPEVRFLPVILVDGEPVDPDVAVSALARGWRRRTTRRRSTLDAKAFYEFRSAARLGDWRRYDAVLTAAAKIEIARLRSGVESLAVHRGRGAGAFRRRRSRSRVPRTGGRAAFAPRGSQVRGVRVR